MMPLESKEVSTSKRSYPNKEGMTLSNSSYSTGFSSISKKDSLLSSFNSSYSESSSTSDLILDSTEDLTESGKNLRYSS